MPDGTVTSWPEFQIAFRAWHIPHGLMHQKKEEFLKLRQGETTVVEYHRKFLELSRYAEKESPLTLANRRNSEKDCNPI